MSQIRIIYDLGNAVSVRAFSLQDDCAVPEIAVPVIFIDGG